MTLICLSQQNSYFCLPERTLRIPHKHIDSMEQSDATDEPLQEDIEVVTQRFECVAERVRRDEMRKEENLNAVYALNILQESMKANKCR